MVVAPLSFSQCFQFHVTVTPLLLMKGYLGTPECLLHPKGDIKVQSLSETEQKPLQPKLRRRKQQVRA